MQNSIGNIITEDYEMKKGRTLMGRTSPGNAGVDKAEEYKSQKKQEEERKNQTAPSPDNYNYNGFTIPESCFKTPALGDFYLGAVDTEYLKKLDKILSKVYLGDDKPDDGNPKASAFYTETPPRTKTGYDNGNFMLKIKASDIIWDGGLSNAGRLVFKINSVKDNQLESNVADNFISTMLTTQSNFNPVTSESLMSFSMYGIAPKETGIEAIQEDIGSDENVETIQYTMREAQESGNCLYHTLKGEAIDSKYSFYKIGNHYFQINSCEINGVNRQTVVLSNSFHANLKEAEKQRDLIKKAINKAGEVYLYIDSSSFALTPFEGLEYINGDKECAAIFNKHNDDILGTAADIFKMNETAHRAGIAYIKIDEKWVNLAKLAIIEADGTPANEFNGSDAKIFNQEYDPKKKFYGDAFFDLVDQLDDRKKIQKTIFNKDWDALHKWTVTIGDVTLLVPPTSIQVVSETSEERMPLLRAKGSMPKSGKHTTRSIAMNIYFNGENGINGYKYDKAVSPNGKKLVYSMNGLRALISEFKFCPFLPIENEYINKTMNIQAVVFNNIQIQPVTSIGPKLFQAQLTMTEFNWAVYMPEMAAMCASTDKTNTNWFSACFNWATMRYYYQRALSAGDEMAKTGKNVNSPEYIKASLKNRTALQPMNFKSSKMQFFLADTEYLDQMLNLRKQQIAKGQQQQQVEPFNPNALTGGELIWYKRIKEIGDIFQEANEDDSIKAQLASIEGSGLNAAKEKIGTLNNSLVKLYSSKGYDKVYENTEPSVYTVPYCETNSDETLIYFGIKIYYNSGLYDHSSLSSLEKMIKTHIADRSKNAIFDNNIICLRYIAEIVPAKDELRSNFAIKLVKNVSIDIDTDDYKAIDFCRTAEEAYSEARKGQKEYGENLAQFRSSVNAMMLDDLKFKPFDCGNFVVTEFAASLSNRVSRINVCNVTGSTPQYLGGEDTVFSVALTTRDKKCAEAFANLPSILANIMRQYRMVIPCCPLKVDSEFTRFLGVNEVTINNSQVSTIPNQPGTYRITFDMRSSDRTLRNREALEKLEADNYGKKYEQNTYEKDILSGIELEDTIAQAELYPDLELPTLNEMLSYGWDFVRYKFQDNRVHVDPDFYFVYLTQLSSQFLRSAVLGAANAGYDGSSTFKDPTGAMMTMIPEKDIGYTVQNANEEARRQWKKALSADSLARAQNAYGSRKVMQADGTLYNDDDFQVWTICNDIRAMFMEGRYKKEYDAYYEAAKKNIKAGKEANEAAIDQKIAYQQDDKKITKDMRTEGCWVYSMLDNARKASDAIQDYLVSTPINLSDEDEETEYTSCDQRELFIAAKNGNGDIQKAYAAVKQEIELSVKRFLGLPEVENILKLLNFEMSESFIKVASDIIFSAACAATGEKEFSNKKNSFDWMPAPDFVGISAAGGTQDASAPQAIYDSDIAADNAIEFGIFRLKMYSLSALRSMVGEDMIDQDFLDTVQSGFPLDPYYRKFTEAERKSIAEDKKSEEPQNIAYIYAMQRYHSYRINCINSIEYCTFAYMRIMLVWLKILIDNQVFPAINADILRRTTHTELEIKDAEEKCGVTVKSYDADIRDHIKFFSKNIYTVDAGKLWTLAELASTDGDRVFLERIYKRDYNALDEYVRACSNPRSEINFDDRPAMLTRKMILSLIAVKRIDNDNAIGVKQDTKAAKDARRLTETKYMACADDPKTFMMHACHDMIVHDARGRMLRAFPTYYMMFIDEGRDVGLWHLHDNFYNNMAIMDFTVVKDKVNPADTATITMSNFYQAFTTEADDQYKYQEYGIGEVLDYMWDSSGDVAKKEELKRQQKPMEDRVRLRAGARIHLRAGYGSSAAMLPVIFNGCIAEVNAEDTVNIVAQGDGIELANPILEESDAKSAITEKGFTFTTNGATPREIVQGFLTKNGGILASALKGRAIGEILGNNPYGIYHFGNKDFKEIFESGEITQNIYETWEIPSLGNAATWTGKYYQRDEDGKIIKEEEVAKTEFLNNTNGYDEAIESDEQTKKYAEKYGKNKAKAKDFWVKRAKYAYTRDTEVHTDGAPKITFDVFGKTIWEVTNICRSLMPSFVCAVLPFGTRSTLFMGAPRYYYAYGYTMINGVIQEKRKPFEQFHVYTSGSDIVANGIVATSQKMKTVATGLYEYMQSLTIKSQGKVGPIYADINIYPEFQKSMIVNTNYLGNGVPYLGFITNSIGNLADSFSDDKGSLVAHGKIARRMTVSALRESMTEMYAGDMVVLGDPSVKPLDRMYILDNYEGIAGQARVKEVVHHMSVDQGFITTLSPDCIVTAKEDDKFEPIVHHYFSVLGGCAAAHFMTGATIGFMSYKDVKSAKDVLVAAKNAAKTYMESHSEIKEAYSKIREKVMSTAEEAYSDLKKEIKTLEAISDEKKQAERMAEFVRKTIKSEKAAEIIKDIPKSGKVVKSCSAFLKIIKAAKAGAAAGTLIFPGAGTIAGAITSIMVTIMWETLGHFVNTYLEDFLKNGEAMRVYPLKRYDLPWTAGLGGSKGMIVGSVSYHDEGLLGLITRFIAPESTVGQWLSSFVFYDSLQEYAAQRNDRFKKSEEWKYRQKFDDTIVQNVSLMYPNLQKDYQHMIFSPRADYNSPAELTNAFNYYSVESAEKFRDNAKFQYLKFISDDTRLKPYISEDFFRIIHETPELEQSKNVDTQILTVNGVERYVKVIRIDNGDGTYSYDLPMLNPDAIDILYELIKRAKEKMPGAHSTDQHEYWNDNSNSFILLESAFRAGEISSHACTGFTFILEAQGNAADALKSSIEELAAEIEEQAEANGISDATLFECISQDNQYTIIVHMPRIGEPQRKQEAFDTVTVLNNNKPEFSEEELNKARQSFANYECGNGYVYAEQGAQHIIACDEYVDFEDYDNTDEAPRAHCGIGLIGPQIYKLGLRDRKELEVKPSGWPRDNDRVSETGYTLFHRCHLIGHALSGQDDNKYNLVTGTEYMNEKGMAIYEGKVKKAAENGTHVLYRVTAIYEDDNLVCSGVKMEGYSIHDNGASVCFNVFIKNFEPGYEINYKDGSWTKIE